MPKLRALLMVLAAGSVAGPSCGVTGRNNAADAEAVASAGGGANAAPDGANQDVTGLAPATSSPNAVLFHPSADGSLCLGVEGAENVDGAAVRVARCDGSAAQTWSHNRAAFVVFGNKCLGSKGEARGEGSPLQIWTCDPSASNDIGTLWQLDGNSLRWQKDPNKCLDAPGGAIASGAAPQLATCATEAQNQQWVVGGDNTDTPAATAVGQTSSSTAASYALTAASVVVHPLADASFCLDVAGAKNVDGTSVQIYRCNGTAAQQWTQVGSVWRIFDNKCLNLRDGVNGNGTRLQIWTCDPATSTDKNNFWQFTGGTLRWQGDPGKCLDVTGGVYASGTPAQIWGCSSANRNQQWATASAAATSGPSTGTQGAGTPSTGATSKRFTLGAIIDYDGLGPHGRQSVQDFINNTHLTPGVVDSYVQMKTDGTFELDTAKSLISQASAGKVPAVCLSVTSQVQGKLSSNQLNQLVSALSYAKGLGVSVQVRFGYEMNGYWSPSNVTNGAPNNPANFLLQWAQVAPVVHAAGGLMFWSPNIPFDSNSALARWLPSDASTIDLVGIDYYPKNNPLTVDSVRSAIQTIYPIAQQLNKPMLFGESGYASTGSSYIENASEAQAKVKWLSALSDPALRAQFPLYQGFRWFDYQKYENNTKNNYSISADPYAASAVNTWYSEAYRP